ncbi:MAG: Yip1 family protein [Candidatus Aenigmatarchaeota archaeon]
MAKLGIVKKAKFVMLKPSKFFAKVKTEKGISDPFRYLAMVSLVYAIGNYLVSSPVSMISKEFLAVFSYAAGLLSPFVSAWITNIIARLLGGKGKYHETYKAYVYASTPSLLFGWVPLIGVIPSLYTLYLSVLGISKYHRIGMWKALAAVILFPILVAIILAFVIAGFAYTFLK